MDEIYERSLLLDFYGELLTKKQREICLLSMTEDWSLSEIADSLSISRQGVSDTLKRSEKILFETEEKLGFCKRFLALKKELDHLSSLVEEDADKEVLLQRIQGLKEAAIPSGKASS